MTQQLSASRLGRSRARSKAPIVSNAGQEATRAQGVTATLLAKMAGASIKSASNWLRGSKVPSDAHAARIDAALGIDPMLWRRSPGGVTEVQRVTPALVNARPRPAAPAAPVAAAPRTAPRPGEWAVPADWKRKPDETRAEMFARRGAWLGARQMAEEADLPPPALTSDVDREAVALWRGTRIAEIGRRRGEG